MNYKEAVRQGYEMVTGVISEEHAAEVEKIAFSRLMDGWQVVIVKSEYHGEKFLTVMVKR